MNMPPTYFFKKEPPYYFQMLGNDMCGALPTGKIKVDTLGGCLDNSPLVCEILIRLREKK